MASSFLDSELVNNFLYISSCFICHFRSIEYSYHFQLEFFSELHIVCRILRVGRSPVTYVSSAEDAAAYRIVQ